MKAILLSLLFLLPSITMSDAELVPERVPTEFCRSENENLIFRRPVAGVIRYFAKPIVGKELKISLIDEEKQGVVLDMNTGEVIKIPALLDPVASPDGKLFSILEDVRTKVGEREVKSDHIHLFPTRSLNEIGSLSKPPPDVPVYVDRDLQGVYQSLAKIPEISNKYRMLVDLHDLPYKSVEDNDVMNDNRPPNNIAFRDYIVTDKEIQPADGVQHPCKGQYIQTPYLSKDGKFVVGLDLKAQTTKVYSLMDGCKPVKDVGYRTGKADFSYDGKKIAFHVTEMMDREGNGWVLRPSEHNVSNIYVYDLETGDTEQITKNTFGNSYYPAFLPDGTLMHMDALPDEKGYQRYSIAISRTAIKPAEKTESGMCLTCDTAKATARYMIGLLVNVTCKGVTDPGTDAPPLISKALALNQDQCRKLVEKYWTEELPQVLTDGINFEKLRSFSKSDMLSLKKDDLLIACPQPATTEPVGPRKINARPRSCTACHGDSFPLDDVTALSKTKSNHLVNGTLKDEILLRLRGGDKKIPPMPPPGYPLPKEEREAIDRYIKKLTGE